MYDVCVGVILTALCILAPNLIRSVLTNSKRRLKGKIFKIGSVRTIMKGARKNARREALAKKRQKERKKKL